MEQLPSANPDIIEYANTHELNPKDFDIIYQQLKDFVPWDEESSDIERKYVADSARAKFPDEPEKQQHYVELVMQQMAGKIYKA